MGEGDVKDLTRSIKEMLGRFDQVLEKLDIVEVNFEAQAKLIETHNKILFGDGDSIKGLIGRQSRMEDRFAIFWTSIGVLVSATIVAAVNFFFHR